MRATALSAFGLEPVAFVAASTLIGVIIDLVRTPVYLIRAAAYDLGEMWMLIALMIAGVVAGTLVGERLLLGLSHERFRKTVSVRVGSVADVIEIGNQLRAAGVEASEPKLYAGYAPDYWAIFFTEPRRHSPGSHELSAGAPRSS